MSQENVEIVRRIQPAPDVDLTVLFRHDATSTVAMEAVAPLFHEDFACRVLTPDQTRFFSGLDGLRSAWLDWLEPWESYRTEIDDVRAVDAERVLVLAHDYARREGSSAELAVLASGVWTVRDGKVAAAEFFSNRAEALEAVGLRE